MATAKTTKMASEYHSSSFATNTNTNNTRLTSYKSNAFSAPRTGSLRLKAREPPPSVHMTASAAPNKVRTNNTNNFRDTTEQKLNTINLMKSIKSSQLAAAATKATTITTGAPAVTSTKSSTTTVNAFTLGSNKSYYSSTRSFSSKIVDKSKLAASSSTTTATMQQSSYCDKSCAKSTTSSGTSSIESIVPKYNGFVSGSKKRIYSSVRVTKKEMPSYHNGSIVTVNATQTATKFATTVQFTASNKKQMTEINDENEDDEDGGGDDDVVRNCRTIETISSNLCSSSTTSTSSYSTKFPNGLPFEDEFYHKRRNSTSTKSEVSDYGSYENDDDDDNDADRGSLLPFEDEFARQRPSSNDEALYVDFSKPIASTRKNITTHDVHEHNTNRNRHHFGGGGGCNGRSNNNNNNNKTIEINKYETTKSSSNRNYVCNPNEVIIRDQPVVYVAVQWWASANSNNNREHHTSASHAHSHYNCNVAEPIQTNLM